MWLAVGLVLSAQTLAVVGGGFDGLEGSFCASRVDGCCNNRQDYCSVPARDTRCYCDQFCNRTKTNDCCPDYWSHCMGIELPTSPPGRFTGCYAGGRYYQYGDEVKVNCNNCKCTVLQGGEIGLQCEENVCLVDDTVITKVNMNRGLGWRAANYSNLWGKTLSDGITFRTGTLEPHKTVKNMQPIMVKDQQPLPQRFDSRTKWPRFIGNPMDQGWCGASWVLSTVAVASDRFGIMSGGLENVKLSPQHLLSCNNRGQQGCQGGHLSRAWMYVRKFGLVDEDCYPWAEGKSSKCRLSKKTSLRTAHCKPQSTQTYRTELYKVSPAYRIKGEEDIMHEIMASGPVQATIMVYQDFFSYKSGIYVKSPYSQADAFGYHSVRIIGWGEDEDYRGQPVKYWLAANSWGSYWGENGFFKIIRGRNECDIESFVLAAWAKTSKPATADVQENDISPYNY